MSKKKYDRFSLELSLERLLADLAQATKLIEATERIHAPLEAEFKEAHARCVALTGGQLPRDRKEYLEALNWRMTTGYECHPTRESLKDLNRWRKLVLEEIKDIRAQLEKPKKPDAPSSRGQERLL